MNSLLLLNDIIGSINDEKHSERIHSLSHAGNIEYIEVDPIDLSRKKFKAKTSTGRTCAVSLPRDSKLENGSILCLENDFAIVLKTKQLEWIAIKPKDISVAIELGYFAGNMHWQVKFSKDHLCIALNSPKSTYLDRLSDFLSRESIVIISND